MGEYIKQALQNEAFSKIHGIRALQRNISSSIPGSMSRIEVVRLSLLQGLDVPLADCDALLAQEKAEPSDTRDWELLPDFAPHIAPTRTMTSLGKEMDEDGVRTLSVLTGLAGYVAQAKSTEVDLRIGASVSHTTVLESGTDVRQVLPAEHALFDILSILNAAQSSATSEGGKFTTDLEAAVDRLLSSVQGPDLSRWQLLYSGSIVAQATTIMRASEKAILGRQPAGSKKKVQLSPADSTSLDLIRTVFKLCQEDSSGLLKQLEAAGKQDKVLSDMAIEDEFPDVSIMGTSMEKVKADRVVPKLRSRNACFPHRRSTISPRSVESAVSAQVVQSQ